MQGYTSNILWDSLCCSPAAHTRRYPKHPACRPWSCVHLLPLLLLTSRQQEVTSLTSSQSSVPVLRLPGLLSTATSHTAASGIPTAWNLNPLHLSLVLKSEELQIYYFTDSSQYTWNYWMFLSSSLQSSTCSPCNIVEISSTSGPVTLALWKSSHTQISL